jgi:hypothetical protein
MASSEELFHHAYRDGLQALELSRAENEVERKTVLADPRAGLPRRILFEEYDKTIRAVLKSLTPSSPDAESVLRGGLNALRLVEELRFIFANLLEAVKRDDSLHNSLTRYRDLGLIDNVNLTDVQDEKRTSPWLFNRDSGQLLRKLCQGLRKVALIVMEIVANAVKVVPKFVSLKPKPSIGLAGPFPTFDLQFDLEAESLTIHELFHDLIASLGS